MSSSLLLGFQCVFVLENPYLIRYSREMIVNLLKVDIEFNLSLFEYIFLSPEGVVMHVRKWDSQRLWKDYFQNEILGAHWVERLAFLEYSRLF